MKTVVKIAPRMFNVKWEDDGWVCRYTYTPTSKFLKVLSEFKWLHSKVVFVSNYHQDEVCRDFGNDCVDKDGLEILFEYKRRERKLFQKEVTTLLMQKDVAKTYYSKMKNV